MLKQAVKYVVGSAISGREILKCNVGGVECLVIGEAAAAVDDQRVAEMINAEFANWDIVGDLAYGFGFPSEVLRSEWRKNVEVYVLDNGVVFSRYSFNKVFGGDPSRFMVGVNHEQTVVAFYSEESGKLIGFVPAILEGETVGSLFRCREG